MNHLELIERLIKSPLYQKVNLKSQDIDADTRRILLHEGRFDWHCPSCRKNSTWQLVVNPENEKRAQRESMTSVVGSHGGMGRTAKTIWSGEFKLRISCTREPLHTAVFHFISSSIKTKESYNSDDAKDASNAYIVKIGQHPSLADFESGDLSGLEKGLSDEQRGDFLRAIKTASHGFFIAACVYYRRVFESIINDAKNDYMAKRNSSSWPEYEEASSTADRIKLLKSELPSFLVDHPHLYKLLSIGVHKLTEEQCGHEIANIRQAIEHIVYDRITLRQQEAQKIAVSKFISQSVDKHTNEN